ncbi:alpha/beta hydrolase [Pacificimonas flava]|nr:alpha/beta hydrolase [Pacificimonas flava]MBB5278917.1 polyhydroxyalkanoate synthase [Pacificimonas flava]
MSAPPPGDSDAPGAGHAASAKRLARGDAAQQYALPARGPHPLPLFLELVRQAAGNDRGRRQRILAAVARYQAAPPASAPSPPPRLVAAAGSARLLSFADAGPPLLLVPSLINPPDILDLDRNRSLARWLAGRGYAVHMIDWGRPRAEELHFDLGDYVTQRLEPLARHLERPVLAGYCLGGTLAMAATVRGKAGGLVTLATPWRFGGYPDERRKEVRDYWAQARRVAEGLSAVPMSLVQPAFWALDPQLPPRKFERYAVMADGSEEARRFERMEDWASSGAPIALPAMEEAVTGLFAEDRTGAGEWRVGGTRIRPQDISVPWIDIAATGDRLVPATAAPPAPDARQARAGHVGMIAGSRARHEVWEPMAAWLASL